MANGCLAIETQGMPSPKLFIGRHSRVGNVYSVTTVVGGRAPLFLSDEPAKQVIAAIQGCELNGLARSMAWVVMPEHMHWLFSLERGSLGGCVQRFKSISARAINANRACQGAVWQRGYYEHCLRNEDDLLAQARYIVANPLRRGLAERIEDYPYWWARHIRTAADL